MWEFILRQGVDLVERRICEVDGTPPDALCMDLMSSPQLEALCKVNHILVSVLRANRHFIIGLGSVANRHSMSAGFNSVVCL